MDAWNIVVRAGRRAPRSGSTIVVAAAPQRSGPNGFAIGTIEAGDRALVADQTLDENAITLDGDRAVSGAEVGSQPQARRTGRGPLFHEPGFFRHAIPVRTTPLRPIQGHRRLSDEQRERIHTVIGSHREARVDHVDFSVSVGTRVPRTVHVVALPEEVIRIVPQYRGFRYIVVRNEILIIDPDTFEIVAVLPA